MYNHEENNIFLKMQKADPLQHEWSESWMNRHPSQSTSKNQEGFKGSKGRTGYREIGVQTTGE